MIHTHPFWLSSWTGFFIAQFYRRFNQQLAGRITSTAKAWQAPLSNLPRHYHSGDIKESIMSKRNPTKPPSRSCLKRSSVPTGKPVDISLETSYQSPNPRHRMGTLEDWKRLGLDTEEEFIILLWLKREAWKFQWGGGGMLIVPLGGSSNTIPKNKGGALSIWALVCEEIPIRYQTTFVLKKTQNNKYPSFSLFLLKISINWECEYQRRVGFNEGRDLLVIRKKDNPIVNL